MPTDDVQPLATSAQFLRTAYADLASNLQDGELDDIMIQASRACEQICHRRLLPFTITESHQAIGIDPDEYGAGLSSVPMDMAGALGRSYARALGASDLVRHLWLSECAPCYQDMWGTYQVTGMQLFRSIGGSQTVQPTSLVGPEPDTGHVLFQLGTFLPIGTTIRVTYTGGYSTIPADLTSACLAMAASITIKRLDPSIGSQHDPDLLRDEAVEFLDPYMRD